MPPKRRTRRSATKESGDVEDSVENLHEESSLPMLHDSNLLDVEDVSDSRVPTSEDDPSLTENLDELEELDSVLHDILGDDSVEEEAASGRALISQSETQQSRQTNVSNAAASTSATSSATSTNSVVSIPKVPSLLSDEARMKRALRFGVPVKPSAPGHVGEKTTLRTDQVEKMKSRRERFGTGKRSVEEFQEEKLKRAARFGIVTKEVAELKKQERAQRFAKK